MALPILRKLRWGSFTLRSSRPAWATQQERKEKSYTDICIVVYNGKQSILSERQESELGVGSRSLFCGSSSPHSQGWQWIQHEFLSCLTVMNARALLTSRAWQATLKSCQFVLTFTLFWRIVIGKNSYALELSQSLKSGSSTVSGLLNLQNKKM